MFSSFLCILQKVHIAIPTMEEKLRNLGRQLFDQVTCDVHLMRFVCSNDGILV